MEQNSLAMETLILCYIEAKNLLRTKQLDQAGFNKLLIKSCEGLNYSDEEILSTWRNLVSQYLQVKNNSLEKESWKYFKIMDSCYEVSDFHQSGQTKFSDEMVWFLIECLLLRRDNRKRSHNLERMIEVYHKFLEEGYEILLLSDIQTKWRYLNYRYSKLEGTKEAHLKMQYFTALDEFRKGKKCVKINFTKSLTEILIRKFTEKKVMCNFHGYDSPKLLNEIQSEFQNLDPNAGFDFTSKEIKDKWDKLTYVYEFLKKKHRTESQWMYFHAMREHFEDDIIENEVKLVNTTENVLKKRSKSVGEQNKNKKSKLTVIDQIDEKSMSPLKIKNKEEIESSFDSIASIKTQKVEKKKEKNISDENCGVKLIITSENLLKKKSKSDSEPNKNKKSKPTVSVQSDKRSKSPLESVKEENFYSFNSTASIKLVKDENKKNENISNVAENPPKSNDKSKKKEIFKTKESKHNYNEFMSCASNNHSKVVEPVRTKKIGKNPYKSVPSSPLKNQKVVDYPKTKKKLKVNQMKNLTIPLDNIENMKEMNSAELLTSQKSEVLINNNESNMDGNSTKITINLPSIAQECSGDEFLPVPDVNDEYVEQLKSLELLTSDKSEVHTNNTESNIDKDSCNKTIHLPSITKQFSGNEYLPLKKRLRLNEDKLSPTKEIKDGFLGFSVMDQIHAQSSAQARVCSQLIEEVTPAKIVTDIPVTEDMTDITGEEDRNDINYTSEENYESEESGVSHRLLSHNNFSPPSVESPKKDHHPSPEQSFHANGLSPQPVLSFVTNIDEINSSEEGGTSCELHNGLSLEKYEEIEGEDNSDRVEDSNDPHHIADHTFEDTFLKESVSTELIETSIVDETITEMEIRSSGYYQKPDIPIQYRSLESVESEIPGENNIFVEETNLTPKNMEFSNETLDTSSEYATVDTNYESPHNNLEYHAKILESSINHPETQTEFQNYEVQTKCNSTYSSPVILEGNEVANFQYCHKSNISPPSQCNSNLTAAGDSAGNVKTEMKSVRLPVSCGGKLKEIFISPKELSKIVRMKPNSVKHSQIPPVIPNGYVAKNNCKNIKFISQVVKEANVTFSDNHNLTHSETLNNGNMIPAAPKFSSSTGFLVRNQQSPICADGEFDRISIVSSIMDDERLGDDLLADVIEDFQAQSNQELKDIKNLVRENNLLQRETNRIMRQILEKL